MTTKDEVFPHALAAQATNVGHAMPAYNTQPLMKRSLLSIGADAALDRAESRTVPPPPADARGAPPSHWVAQHTARARLGILIVGHEWGAAPGAGLCPAEPTR